jgi:hypothetical protein
MVAIADPLDALAVSDIGVITKSEARVAVASDPGIDAVLATLPTSKRPNPLSARGMDGLAGARAAEVNGWTLAESISSPEPAPAPAVMPDPMLEPTPAPERSALSNPVEQPAPAAEPAPGPSPELESRIEALVAAALEKRLDPVPAPDTGDGLERAHEQLALTRAELEQSRQEAARAREAAAQARAEVEALSARIEQLESQPQPSEPSVEDPRLSDHFARVMRELDEPAV